MFIDFVSRFHFSRFTSLISKVERNFRVPKGEEIVFNYEFVPNSDQILLVEYNLDVHKLYVMLLALKGNDGFIILSEVVIDTDVIPDLLNIEFLMPQRAENVKIGLFSRCENLGFVVSYDDLMHILKFEIDETNGIKMVFNIDRSD